jgi:hypothetical protein
VSVVLVPTNWSVVFWTLAMTAVGAFAALWAQGAPVNRGMRSALYATILFVGFLVMLVGALALVTPSVSPIFVLPGLVICLPVWKPIRRLAARIMPIDPDSATDMVALIVVLLMLLFGARKLLYDAGADPTPLVPVSPIEPIVVYLGLAGFSFFAVGLGLRRTWAAALSRLGLVRPGPADIALGVATAFVVGVIGLGLRVLAPPDAPPTDVLTLTLDSQAGGPLAGVLVSLSIALGVELFFRGAFQPRIGLPVTALAYLATIFLPPVTPALLAPIALALALGALRRWTNATTCIIAHALYNCALILAPLVLR